MFRPLRLPILPVTACVVALVSFAVAAHADEIEVLDLEKCTVSKMQVYEITTEDQSFVYYRTRRSGDEEKIPTVQVVSVTRSSENPAQAERLAGARSDIAQGNYEEALSALQGLHGGGWKTDANTMERYFTPFDASDKGGSRNRRPSWVSEYAHFFYAKALYERAKAEDRQDLYEEALQALEDQKIDVSSFDEDGKRETTSGTTGGFLKRFEGGNSRWYPDAMALHAKTLTALGKYDDAKKAYSELFDSTVRNKLHPRYAYVASMGDGEIGRAKGDLDAAMRGFESGTIRIKELLKNTTENCLRLELGRYFSLVRNEAAQIKLEDAMSGGGRNAAKFASLKKYLEDGLPENIRSRFPTETTSVQEALVQGARAPEVQAVASLGLGLALKAEKRYDEALVALKEVIVKYFAREKLAAEACKQLIEAASEAAKAANSPEAKEYYQRQADIAKTTLRTQYAHLK